MSPRSPADQPMAAATAARSLGALGHVHQKRRRRRQSSPSDRMGAEEPTHVGSSGLARVRVQLRRQRRERQHSTSWHCRRVAIVIHGRRSVTDRTPVQWRSLPLSTDACVISQAPAGGPAGLADISSGHAPSSRHYPPRAAAFTDLCDDAIRLKWRAGHCVRRCCEGQREASNSDEPHHSASPFTQHRCRKPQPPRNDRGFTTATPRPCDGG
jgi:hypothetical protein